MEAGSHPHREVGGVVLRSFRDSYSFGYVFSQRFLGVRHNNPLPAAGGGKTYKPHTHTHTGTILQAVLPMDTGHRYHRYFI